MFRGNVLGGFVLFPSVFILDYVMNDFELKQCCMLNEKVLVERLEIFDPKIQQLLNRQISKNANLNSQIYGDWLAWCKLQNNRVKVIENEIPNEIFPPQFRGSIYDIKVQGKKRAPDDQLYSDHEDLR